LPNLFGWQLCTHQLMPIDSKVETGRDVLSANSPLSAPFSFLFQLPLYS